MAFRITEQTNEEILGVMKRHSLFLDGHPEKFKIRRVAKTQNSKLYVVSGDGLCKPILVKKLISGNSEDQFKALQFVPSNAPDPTCRTARPIAFDAKENILLMEYIGGRTVLRVLKGLLVNPNDKRACVEDVGRWLASFHMQTETAGGSVDAARRLDGVEECLRKVGEHVKKDREISSALHYLRSTVNVVDCIPVTSCTIHGDCKPENFIVSEDNVVGIDLATSDKGLPLMDVAQFANHIMFLSLSLPNFNCLDQLGQWVDYFVDAYRGTQSDSLKQLLRWLRVGHYLRYWAAEKSRGGLLGRAQSVLLRKLIIRDMRCAA